MIYHLLLVALSQMVWLFALVIVFVPLEQAFAVNRQSILRPRLKADLGFYFLSSIIPALVFAAPIGFIATLARHFIPNGYFDFVASLPMAVKIVAGLFVGEIGFYWAHRAMHAYPALWQFHAVHHDPERMDWLINSRMHPIDLIFTHMAGLALVTIAGLGSPGGVRDQTVPIIVSFAGIIWSFYIHSNVRWRMGWLEHIVSTARFHHWHHSRVDHPNHNFASMLPIFDRMFGTLHMPKGHAWPPSYGIAPPEEWRFDNAEDKTAPEKAAGEKTAA